MKHQFYLRVCIAYFIDNYFLDLIHVWGKHYMVGH